MNGNGNQAKASSRPTSPRLFHIPTLTKAANEFASLPGKFATVGKLSFSRKPLAQGDLRSAKK